MSIRRVTSAALAGVLLVGVIGCRREEAPKQKLTQEPPSIGSAPPRAPSPSPMRIGVAEVRGDPSIDIDGVRVALRDAEGAFASCLDTDGSTGVIALRIPIEPNGAAGDIGVAYTTTYGSEEARSCFTRIVGAMRFPRPLGASEVQVTLEVSSRAL